MPATEWVSTSLSNGGLKYGEEAWFWYTALSWMVAFLERNGVLLIHVACEKIVGDQKGYKGVSHSTAKKGRFYSDLEKEDEILGLNKEERQ